MVMYIKHNTINQRIILTDDFFNLNYNTQQNNQISLYVSKINKEKIDLNNVINTDNLQVKSCFYRDIFSVRYYTEYFDFISGETGRSGKHESILKAMDEGLNDLYNKNTIGYNCKHRKELYEGYKVRYCYFYPNNTKAWKVIVNKPGLLTEGMSVSKFVDNKSI